MMLGLDVKQWLLMVRTVATGSLASVQVHPHEVSRPVVETGVHSLLLCTIIPAVILRRATPTSSSPTR